MDRDFCKLSVVCPAFEEGPGLPAFHRQLASVLDELNHDYDVEILYVDDGSRDRTLPVLRRLAAEDARVRYLSFSRNFGHQAALTAGLEHAVGDAVVTLDSDLQHPPALIPALLDKWHEGYDVVLTVREEDRSLGWFKRASSRWFYRLMGVVSDTPVPYAAADYRLLSRRAVDEVLRLRESHRFLRGLVQWLGFPHAEVRFTPAPRVAGVTKYTPRRLVNFGLDAVMSFSKAPLRLVLALGFAAAVFGLLAGLYSVVRAVLSPDYPAGWSFVLASVYLMGGAILFSLGLVGEYVGRIFDQVKARPLYVVKERSEEVGEPRVVEAPKRVAA